MPSSESSMTQASPEIEKKLVFKTCIEHRQSPSFALLSGATVSATRSPSLRQRTFHVANSLMNLTLLVTASDPVSLVVSTLKVRRCTGCADVQFVDVAVLEDLAKVEALCLADIADP